MLHFLVRSRNGSKFLQLEFNQSKFGSNQCFAMALNAGFHHLLSPNRLWNYNKADIEAMSCEGNELYKIILSLNKKEENLMLGEDDLKELDGKLLKIGCLSYKFSCDISDVLWKMDGLTGSDYDFQTILTRILKFSTSYPSMLITIQGSNHWICVMRDTPGNNSRFSIYDSMGTSRTSVENIPNEKMFLLTNETKEEIGQHLEKWFSRFSRGQYSILGFNNNNIISEFKFDKVYLVIILYF